MARNWAGQKLAEDDVVWRGAREGNGSSFKIGRIVSFSEGYSKARVHWLWEQWWDGPHQIDSYGSPTVHSLVKIDPESIELAL